MNQREKFGFLVLHGFGGSPFEVDPIVRSLKDMGFKNIICPILPGHCEDISSFKKNEIQRVGIGGRKKISWSYSIKVLDQL